ncbi:DUF6268 family outer membrane beta-barrel protein [Bremerella cremea]|uniref:DUF6268 family outer membrane beta-barrel protein n=1 Tax=Bremerella cremea TaxID=1031537 RepID=UPI0031E8BB2C
MIIRTIFFCCLAMAWTSLAFAQGYGQPQAEPVGYRPAEGEIEVQEGGPYIETEVPNNYAPPSVVDSGVWQLMVPRKGSATFTYLGGGGNDGLGITSIDTSASFMAPLPIWGGMYGSLTPGFDWVSLNGPSGFDLPSDLYRGSLSLGFIKPFESGSQLVVGISPTFATDGHADASDAFQFNAFGMYNWKRSEKFSWQFGIAATGRDDIPVLPVVGFTWKPNDNWEIEASVPRPRISHRLQWFPSLGENWAYVAGEFGGGTYGVDRNGTSDQLTLRDFRLLLGWERRNPGGFSPAIEAGYVFGRELEYESDGSKFKPSDTFLIRASVSF